MYNLIKCSVILFFSFYSTAIFAQSDLIGKWQGVLINDGGTSKLLQEWIIDNNSIKINLIKEEGKKIWKTYSYEVKGGEITLIDESNSLIFNILKWSEQKIIIENKEKKYIFCLKKNELKKVAQPEIPFLKVFKFNTEIPHFQDYIFSFIEFAKGNFLLIFKEDSLIGKKYFAFSPNEEHTTFLVKLANAQMDFVIFEEINGDEITGFINGKMLFQGQLVEQQSITKEQLLAKRIIQKSKGLFEINLEKSNIRRITVGKNVFYLKENGLGIYKYLVNTLKGNLYKTHDIEWSISGKLLFIYHDVEYRVADSPGDEAFVFRGMEEAMGIFYVKKITENNWILKQITNYVPRIF